MAAKYIFKISFQQRKIFIITGSALFKIVGNSRVYILCLKILTNRAQNTSCFLREMFSPRTSNCSKQIKLGKKYSVTDITEEHTKRVTSEFFRILMTSDR